MNDHEKSVFLAKAMNWQLEFGGNPLSDQTKYIYLVWGGDKAKNVDGHMIGFLKTVPVDMELDDIFFPDLFFEQRNAYFILWAIRWGYEQIPGFKKWLDEPGSLWIVVLGTTGLNVTMNTLIEEVRKNADT